MKKVLRQVRAWINRTFVADCPVCHQHFYGNKGYEVHTRINNKNYRIVCRECYLLYKNDTKRSNI